MRYVFNMDVESAHGSQSFWVDADSMEDAKERAANGEGEFDSEEVEVYSLGEADGFQQVEDDYSPEPSVYEEASHLRARITKLEADLDEAVSAVADYCDREEEIAELEGERDGLRCCGNCADIDNAISAEGVPFCDSGKSENIDRPVHPSGVCPHWTPEGDDDVQ